MTDQPRRKYTAEFKREAVELVTKQGYTTAEAARNLGVRSNMLHRWRKQLSAEHGMPSLVQVISQPKLRN